MHVEGVPEAVLHFHTGGWPGVFQSGAASGGA